MDAATRLTHAKAKVSRGRIVYVGSFRHLPNPLAFERLCGEIMLMVWASFPAALLRVVAGPNHERFRQMLRPMLVPRLDQLNSASRFWGLWRPKTPLRPRGRRRRTLGAIGRNQH